MKLDIDDNARITLAKEKTNKLVDHVIKLIGLHQINSIATYSPVLSDQIPKSFAAKAFNIFQAGLFDYEIIKLCALWDHAGPDRESIPTVVKYIDKKSILEALEEEHRAAHDTMFSPNVDDIADPEIAEQVRQQMQRHQKKRAKVEAERAHACLVTAIKDAKCVASSKKLEALKNFRDKHLAHVLTQTYREKRRSVRQPKYGEEKKTLDKTTRIVSLLHLGINGSDFDFENSHRIAKKQAEDLWHHCTFDIKR